ncbi:hypothetical protein [Hymenobacter sp. GOD-10R]|uniref:hypothetical protein n=1 Tax=Hymenobacter sp. GOD-10R TaxID=3093922 RepID=UPI002D7997D3|nr:hypothetical protein [Hymenobacter sp. GOD-10R]WRQ26706.1 hypothetical protein SD425_16660 [Hymenobacter sp. GOD-10R]
MQTTAHPQALPATSFMQVATAQPERQKLHLNSRELREVQTVHLPTQVVRFAPIEEIEREGCYIKAQNASLSEEIDFVVAVEKQRRNLATMQIR